MGLKILHKSVRATLSLLPLVISVIAVEHRSAVLGIISVATMYAVVALLPFTKGFESIWIFLLSTFISIPFNIKLVIVIMRFVCDYFDPDIVKVMFCVCAYIIVYCIEEIILGCFSAMLWKKQRVIS